MTTTLEAIRAGVTYPLNDIGESIVRLEQDGFGMPPVSRLKQRSPMQHGSSDVGFHLEERKVNLVILPWATTEAGYYDAREQLLEIFKPGDDAITLKYSYPTGRVRQLETFLEGGMMFGSSERQGLAHRAVIALCAPDPVWYDPVEQTLTWTITGTNQLVFPITFPIEFIASVISSGQNVAYPGSWLSYPTIVITGPCQNPKIENLTTGEKLELLYNVAAGQIVTITLAVGQKSITDNYGDNLIGALTGDSDLATFHVAPDPEVAGGNNTIKATLGGATPGTTSVQFKWFSRYVGL
jgi:hypothetical protein